MELPRVLAVTCAALLCCTDAAPEGIIDTLLQSRPDLVVYQEFTKCMFPGSTWYTLYRSTRQSGFGPHDSCLRETQLSQLADGSARVRFRYGAGNERNGTLMFGSDGRNSTNFFRSLLDGESRTSAHNVLFVDCHRCKVMKNAGTPDCFLWVRPASLRDGVPQYCHFVFDLLCGASPKYTISDPSCLSDAGAA